MLMLKSYVALYSHVENKKYKRLPTGIKIAPDVFQNVMSKIVQIWNMLRPILMIF
jgi:hypothetical protein